MPQASRRTAPVALPPRHRHSHGSDPGTPGSRPRCRRRRRFGDGRGRSGGGWPDSRRGDCRSRDVKLRLYDTPRRRRAGAPRIVRLRPLNSRRCPCYPRPGLSVKNTLVKPVRAIALGQNMSSCRPNWPPDAPKGLVGSVWSTPGGRNQTVMDGFGTITAQMRLLQAGQSPWRSSSCVCYGGPHMAGCAVLARRPDRLVDSNDH